MNQLQTEPDLTAYHRVRFRFDPERAKVWRAICGYLQRWVDPASPLLDLGAGYGEFSAHIKSGRKYALDINPEMKAYWDPAVNAIIQPATEPLPLASESLRTVFASNFFEHFEQPDGARILNEIRRVLAPGGRFIAVQPNFRLEPGRYFDDYTHRAIYTDAGFRGLLGACGYRIVHCEPRFTPFTMQSRWPKAEWMVRLYLALPYRPLAGQFLVVAEKED